MGPNAAAAIAAAIQLALEAIRAIEKIKTITEGEVRDLTPEELGGIKTGVDQSYSAFEQKLRDRGLI